MKVLLDIPDNKASSLMDVLKSISYVKVQPITDEKSVLKAEIREAVDNLSLARKGKIKLKTARELYNEL